jgi:hypothetical protein
MAAVTNQVVEEFAQSILNSFFNEQTEAQLFACKQGISYTIEFGIFGNGDNAYSDVLWAAMLMKRHDIVLFMIDERADFFDVCVFCHMGDSCCIEMFELVLERNIQMNFEILFSICCDSGYLNFLKHITVRTGKKPEDNFENLAGALLEHYLDTVKYLVCELNFDINKVDPLSGKSYLSYALTRYDCKELVQLLLELGIDKDTALPENYQAREEIKDLIENYEHWSDIKEPDCDV